MIKVKKRKFLLLPGDGIGPEVIGEVKKIITWFNVNKSLDFDMEEALVGGASYDKHACRKMLLQLRPLPYQNQEIYLH